MAEEVKITDLVPVERQDRVKKAQEYFQSIKGIKIDSQQQYEKAIELLKEIKRTIDQLEEDRLETDKPYGPVSRKINEYYRPARTDLQNLEKVFKDGTTKWFADQERKKLELQRKLEAEIEEKRRKEAEKAEAERKKAEAYREQGREDMAQKAEARAETAEAVAVNTVAPIVENTARAAGVSYTKIYKVTVINHAKAVTALAGNPMFHQFLQIDIKGLEKIINASKGMIKAPDGLIAVEDYRSGVRT
jgi:tetratricopeptide (TPR) repeat protein